MHCLSLSITLWLAVINHTAAFTYWIDSTCSGTRDLIPGLAEVTTMGEAVQRRLNSASDTDFQHVYEVAMKRKKDTNDATFKAISGFMDDVSKMTLETNRNAANVRFYCDDGETRWVERKDPATGRNLGGWEDKDNWMLYPTIIRPGCLFTKGGNKETWGETFREYMEGQPPEAQADVRATMSICDKSFYINGKKWLGNRISIYKLTTDFSLPGFPLDYFGGHVSKTILHELSHTKPYKTVDHDATYGWNANPSRHRTIQELSTQELETHADVRGALGQLAVMADRGFTFHRKPREDASEKEKKDYENDIKVGRFHKYDSITKRSVQRRVRRYGSRR